MRWRVLLIFIVTWAAWPGAGRLAAASSETVVQPHCRATLLAELDAVRPGRPVTVGLLLEADEHWHTYWRNPGESGLATRIDWSLPEGFEAGPIHWPTPTKFVTDGPIVNFGYEGPVLLLVEITPPEVLTTQKVTLAAKATWLVCDPGSCLPGRAQLALTLPVTDRDPAVDEKLAERFAQAREAMPEPIAADRVRVQSLKDEAATLAVSLDELPRDMAQVAFFPADGSLFESVARVAARAGTLRITIPRFHANANPARVRGVLKIAEQGWWIDVPITDVPAQEQASQPEGDHS